MSYLQKLRQSRQSTFEKLETELGNTLGEGGNKFQKDTRFWKPSVDKDGNGFAVIRFLPTQHLEGEELPYISYWHHSFEGPGGWYIENSLTTLGKPDPCGEMNTKLWKQGENSEGRRFVSSPDGKGSKRKLTYISNIYVVNDPKHPENNGKVFLYKYGKKIWEKLKLASHPKFPNKKKFNPFDLETGANFNLCIVKEDGWQNYNQSEWDMVQDEEGNYVARGSLFKDEAKLEQILGQVHPLQPFIAPDKFKTYNELKERLDRVMNRVSLRDEDDPLPDEEVEVAVGEDADNSPPWGSAKTAEVQHDDAEDVNFFDDVKRRAGLL